jgi:hypothetical protein
MIEILEFLKVIFLDASIIRYIELFLIFKNFYPRIFKNLMLLVQNSRPTR